jgi:phage-related protein
MTEKRIKAEFHQTARGTEPVREWLKSLSDADRYIIGKDLFKIEIEFNPGMPWCRSLGNNLWECRSSLKGNRISRVIFCVYGSRMILLNGFIKKAQQTPQHEIDLALKRKKEIEV